MQETGNKLPGARLAVVGYWVKAFWPIAVTLVACATVFRQAVVDSILSTPHPGLVYTIFGVLGSAVLLAGYTLLRYVREEALALALLRADGAEREALLKATSWHSDLQSVYQELFSKEPGVARETRLQKLESELFAAEEHMLGRLTLPNFLGGALVGVGLVGTFVGLLGSLADLGSLFSSLINVGGAAADPVAMFGDMLRRLQAPLRGMGTAFVASLYGLAGSLIMGLVNYSVRKTGLHALAVVRRLLRAQSLAGEGARQAGSQGDMPLEPLYALIEAQNSALASGISHFSGLLESHNTAIVRLSERLNEGAIQTERLGQVLGTLEALGHRLQEGNEQALTSLKAIEKSFHTGMEHLLQEVRALARPPSRQWAQWASVAVMVAALVSIGNAWVSYRLNALMMERLASIAQAAQVEKPAMTQRTLTIQAGDQLGTLASRNGVSVEALLRENPQIKNPNRILPGQIIRLPAEAATSATR